MADSKFDAIVIGGGHHGLIIACYLQKAGLKTAIFERLSKLGGAVASEEGPAPGFTMNTCAHWTRFYGHPAYKLFNLSEKGLRYVFPEQNEAMVYDNDTCLVGYSAFRVVDTITGKTEFSEKNAKKTLDEIAKFSRSDRDTAEELMRRYVKKWRKAFRDYRFSPPTPWGVKNELEKLCDDPIDGIDPVYQFMTCQQIAYDLFESEEMRTLFMRAAMTSTGCAPHDVIGLHVLIHNMALVLSLEPPAVAIGGSQSVSDALKNAFTEMGGVFFTKSEVIKIKVENNLASGVRLKDGTEIEANIVVSDLSATQTIAKLVGSEHISSRIIKRINNIRYDRHNIFWANIAVHELPKFKAASFNPDCGPQPRLYIGPRDADYMANKYYAEIFINGLSEKLYMYTSADSIWDKTRAPDNKHIIGIEEFSAPVRFFTKDQWKKIKEQFRDKLLMEWKRYAPNMTRDNVIDIWVQTPYDVLQRHTNMHEGSISCGDMIASQEDRFRPIPELSNYRMPVKNLYLCSSAAHSGIGTGRSSSYNCYQIIAEDLGLQKFIEI